MAERNYLLHFRVLVLQVQIYYEKYIGNPQLRKSMYRIMLIKYLPSL